MEELIFKAPIFFLAVVVQKVFTFCNHFALLQRSFQSQTVILLAWPTVDQTQPISRNSGSLDCSRHLYKLLVCLLASGYLGHLPGLKDGSRFPVIEK